MKDYKNKEWLYKKYVKEGLTSYEIVDLQDCIPPTIINRYKVIVGTV